MCSLCCTDGRTRLAQTRIVHCECTQQRRKINIQCKGQYWKHKLGAPFCSTPLPIVPQQRVYFSVGLFSMLSCLQQCLARAAHTHSHSAATHTHTGSCVHHQRECMMHVIGRQQRLSKIAYSTGPRTGVGGSGDWSGGSADWSADPRGPPRPRTADRRPSARGLNGGPRTNRRPADRGRGVRGLVRGVRGPSPGPREVLALPHNNYVNNKLH